MPDTAALQLETDRMISTRGYTEITKRNASEMLSSSTGSVLVLSVAGGWGGKGRRGKRRLRFTPCHGFFSQVDFSSGCPHFVGHRQLPFMALLDSLTQY